MYNSLTNYNQAVAFIEALSNISHLDRKTPKAAKERLTRVRDFLDFLGNPEKKLKLIHIAGTSGKGSVATMLYNILLFANKKTGCYTSPHTTTFCERIGVNNLFISEKELVRLTNFLKNKLDEFVLKNKKNSLNFFDFSFCLALSYFAEKKCEYAVIETGCGGRYDSTNAIRKPIYTIITNIGRDHLEIIGPTLKDIAYEKAGIIKRGTPLLTGETDKRWIEIFNRQAKLLNCLPAEFSGATKPNGFSAVREAGYIVKLLDWKDLKNIKTDLNGTSFEYNNERYKLKLIGEHQARNAVLAIRSAQDLGIEKSAIKKGLATATYPARMEVIKKHPLIIIDGAHNEDKLKATTKFLNANRYALNAKKYLILGMARSKKVSKTINELLNYFDVVYLTRFQNPFRKAYSYSDWLPLVSKFAKTNKKKIYYRHCAKDALLDILPRLRHNDLLLITGSIFLAGELREHWHSEKEIIKNRKA